MIDRIIDRIQIIIKPNGFKQMLLVIGALFLGAGFVFNHPASVSVGVVMLFLSIFWARNQSLKITAV